MGYLMSLVTKMGRRSTVPQSGSRLFFIICCFIHNSQLFDIFPIPNRSMLLLESRVIVSWPDTFLFHAREKGWTAYFQKFKSILGSHGFWLHLIISFNISTYLTFLTTLVYNSIVHFTHISVNGDNVHKAKSVDFHQRSVVQAMLSVSQAVS